jgi:hypothetical protein
MTEAEWLALDRPVDLFRLKGERRRSGRKLRLFAVACCRRKWDLLVDPRSRRAVEAHEEYADGLIEKAALASASDEAGDATRDFGRRIDQDGVKNRAAWAVAQLQVRLKAEVVAISITLVAGWEAYIPLQNLPTLSGEDNEERVAGYSRNQAAMRAEEQAQAGLFREIFGNPFRPLTIDPAWLDWNGGTIPRLAEAIYRERAFDRLPILADALEEAGCADADLPAHCRREAGHVRGCWALDALLGRR